MVIYLNCFLHLYYILLQSNLHHFYDHLHMELHYINSGSNPEMMNAKIIYYRLQKHYSNWFLDILDLTIKNWLPKSWKPFDYRITSVIAVEQYYKYICKSSTTRQVATTRNSNIFKNLLRKLVHILSTLELKKLKEMWIEISSRSKILIENASRQCFISCNVCTCMY